VERKVNAFEHQVVKKMAKIVGWGCSQKHVNCFDQGFKWFCKSFFREKKIMWHHEHTEGLDCYA